MKSQKIVKEITLKILIKLKLYILIFAATSLCCSAEELRYFIVDNSQQETSELPRRSRVDDLFVKDGKHELLITNQNLQHMISKEIFSKIDLDRDGNDEVILKMHHGGNCCGYEFAVITHRSDYFFGIVEHELLNGALFPSLEIVEIGGANFLEVVTRSEGVDNTSQVQTISLLKFEYGQLRLVSESQNAAIVPALVEVNSYEFDLDNPTQIIKQLHIDSDNKLDKLICDYWSRWGDVVCDIDSSVFSYQDLSLGCDRVGVLNSETNGMKDLVCNRFSRLAFNGAEYVIIDE